MAFVKQIKNRQGILGIWELTEPSDVLAVKFNFSKDEKIRFGTLKLEKRKKEFLAVRLLIEILLGRKTEIYYGKNGNPHIKNSKFNISISHSAELVVVFLSEKKCGIDTENINRNTASVATKYLAPNEMEAIQKCKDQELARIVYWGAKEAIYKCALEMEVQFNTQIITESFTVGSRGSFSARLFKQNKSRLFNLWYFFSGNNVIVYCVESLKSML